MPQNLDAMLVVDAGLILASTPTPSQESDDPTPVEELECCFLIAPPIITAEGLASDRLVLRSVPTPQDDEDATVSIRWRALSLSGNSAHSVTLYRTRTRAVGAPPTCHDEPTTEAARPTIRPLPLPQRHLFGDEPRFAPDFILSQEQDYYLQTALDDRTEVLIDFCFYITAEDEQTSAPVLAGYFWWTGCLTTVR